MVRAIGQAGKRLAAAEEEFRARGIADRPVAGGFVEFKQRQPLAHRNDVVIGDRIGFELDLEGVRVSSGSACSAGTSEPSPVILAMLGAERARSAVRVSLGEETSMEDIIRLLRAIDVVITRLGNRTSST